MAFKDLFKTKAERKAYAKGRRDQYNKEHPKLKWAVQGTHIYMKNGGKVDNLFSGSIPAVKFKTKKTALDYLRKGIDREKLHKQRVIKNSKAGKLNEHDSQDRSFYEYKLVKINERAK